MFAWFASRMAGSIVKVCGGSSDSVDAARVGTAALFSLVDPVGGLVGMGHAAVSAEARSGNPAAKIANSALTLGSLATGGIEFPAASDASEVA